MSKKLLSLEELVETMYGVCFDMGQRRHGDTMAVNMLYIFGRGMQSRRGALGGFPTRVAVIPLLRASDSDGDEGGVGSWPR